MELSIQELIDELRQIAGSSVIEGKPVPVGAWRRWGMRVMRKTAEGWKVAPKRASASSSTPPKKRSQSAVAIVTRDDGHVLMLQRHPREPWMPGKWNLPGGGVDKSETPRAAARREAGEEAGVRIKRLKKVGKYGDGDGGDLHVYHAHGHAGTPQINHESGALKWVHHSDAHKLDVIPVLRPILKHFSKEHGSKIGKK